MNAHKSSLAALALVLGVLAAVLAGETTGYSQSTTFRVAIPFDFYVRGALMPAGMYWVMPEAEARVIGIGDRLAHHAATLTTPITNRAEAKNILVFNQYGSMYFLSEVHWSGYDSARGVAVSPLELEARNSGLPVRTAVAVRR